LPWPFTNAAKLFAVTTVVIGQSYPRAASARPLLSRCLTGVIVFPSGIRWKVEAAWILAAVLFSDSALGLECSLSSLLVLEGTDRFRTGVDLRFETALFLSGSTGGKNRVSFFFVLLGCHLRFRDCLEVLSTRVFVVAFSHLYEVIFFLP
jgi:hypothetical protein